MSDELKKPTADAAAKNDLDRRAALRKLGRFAAVTPPAVGLLLAAQSRPANAQVISLTTDSTT
jgi:hypothetical protein